MEIKVLDSLHRPYHRPLWIVKWVCYFMNQRVKKVDGYIHFKDITTDFYFFLLDKLHEDYPQDSDGIPSQDSVNDVWGSFFQLDNSSKEVVLKDILSKNREKGVETKVYSTYKAASYYLNLADDKLHFVDKKGTVSLWKPSQLSKATLKSGISTKDRGLYLQQILQYDGHFFLAMCLLQKPVKKYDLKIEVEIFKFMQKYYPVSNFDYTSQSHSNYYVVRKRWMDLLNVVNENNALSKVLTKTVKENSELENIFLDVDNNVRDYCREIREKGAFLKQKKQFLAVYQELAKKLEDKSSFVNLYDISKEMKMGYQRFQDFLTQFYQEERLERNIFFINIVSTIDQRKRFYIGDKPVLKIKISKNYGV